MTLGLPSQGVSSQALPPPGPQDVPLLRAVTFVETTPVKQSKGARTEELAETPGQTLVQDLSERSAVEAAPEGEPQAILDKEPSPSMKLFQAMKEQEKTKPLRKKPAAADDHVADATPKRKTAAKLPIDASVTKKKRRCEPRIDYEWSRNQLLGRTGFFGAGQSVKFAYGVGKPFSNFKAAETAAKRWLKDELEKQGCDGCEEMVEG